MTIVNYNIEDKKLNQTIKTQRRG